MSRDVADQLARVHLSDMNAEAAEFVPSSMRAECCGNPVTTNEAANDWMDDTDLNEVKDSCVESSLTVSAVSAASKPLKSIQERLIDMKKKEPVNVVFCGHVDAGKSTIGGQLMFLTGMIDRRTLDKYEREAKEKNRESWYLSWALDTNEEERLKGKTVQCGRAYFETDKRHYVILDAPGHKCFVPNMISGASQADIAILVISARKGEFETGFERAGQTREHAMLVKTAGVKHMIVLVNKMDDHTVTWSQERYKEIESKLSPYLRKCGFQAPKDLCLIPCSGITGAFLKDRSVAELCPWYTGPSLIDYLDQLPSLNRLVDAPFRMPIMDRFKDMGTVVDGKIESGHVRLNDKLVMMPNKVKVEVIGITVENTDADGAMCGENIKLKLKGIEDVEVSPGHMLCSVDNICHVGKLFDAHIVVLDYKSIICPGYSAVMHLHTGVFEVQLKAIKCTIDKKTGERSAQRPRFIKQDTIAIVRLEVANDVACMEAYNMFPQMGRFTLRDETKTVAVGKILKIIS